MNDFGVGAGIKSLTSVYTHNARRTGRTTAMLDNAKDGDVIVFIERKEADRVSRLAKERGVNVRCIVAGTRDQHRIIETGRSCNRVILDHSWIEQYYIDAIDQAGRDIKELGSLGRSVE